MPSSKRENLTGTGFPGFRKKYVDLQQDDKVQTLDKSIPAAYTATGTFSYLPWQFPGFRRAEVQALGVCICHPDHPFPAGPLEPCQ